MKRALEICKAITSKVQKWYEKHNVPTDNSAKEDDDEVLRILQIRQSTESVRESILADLHSYSEINPNNNAESRTSLNAVMAYRHIYLSSPDRNKFREVLKSDASINTAAIKHIILTTGLHIKGAFSTINKQLEQQLIRAVFEELSSTKSFYSQNAFLSGCMISKFSFSMHASHVKENIANDFFRQTRIVLGHALAKVSLYNLCYCNFNCNQCILGLSMVIYDSTYMYGYTE